MKCTYIYIYIFNIVINQYSISVRKNVLNTKHVNYSQGSARESKITLKCLINGVVGWWGGGEKFDQPRLQSAFLFVDQDQHLILVLLCKANLEYNKIFASDWLKPMLTHIYFDFYVLHSKFGFALQEAYL